MDATPPPPKRAQQKQPAKDINLGAAMAEFSKQNKRQRPRHPSIRTTHEQDAACSSSPSVAAAAASVTTPSNTIPPPHTLVVFESQPEKRPDHVIIHVAPPDKSVSPPRQKRMQCKSGTPTPSQVFLCMRRSDIGIRPISCLVDIIHFFLVTCRRQRYVHVEMLFCFSAAAVKDHNIDSFQLLTSLQIGGVNLYKADKQHYAAGKWKYFEVHMAKEELQMLYSVALELHGSPFSMTSMAHVVCGPWVDYWLQLSCVSWLMRLCIPTTDSSRKGYFCAEVIIEAFRRVDPDTFQDVESNSLTPDAMLATIQHKMGEARFTSNILPDGIRPPTKLKLRV